MHTYKHNPLGRNKYDYLKELQLSDKKVIVLVLESARAQYFSDYKVQMPFLQSLANRSCYGRVKPVSPTFSAANSLALLSGTYPETNGLLHIIFLNEDEEFVLAFNKSYTPYSSSVRGINVINRVINGNDENEYEFK